MYREKPLSSNPHIEKKIVRQILETHKRKLGEVKSPMRKFFDDMDNDPALASYRQQTRSATAKRYNTKGSMGVEGNE